MDYMFELKYNLGINIIKKQLERAEEEYWDLEDALDLTSIVRRKELFGMITAYKNSLLFLDSDYMKGE